MENVELILDFLRRHIAVAEQLDDALEDNKINIPESIGLAMSVLGQLPPAYKRLADVNEAAMALTNEERALVISTLEDELDLDNDKVERIVEAGLDIALAGFKMQRAIVS